MKNITLCADDFGQNDDISLGILDLVSMQRLSAVSCLTEFPAFATHAKNLANFHNQVQIGLHFNLTEGKNALGTLSQVILKSHARLLSREKITEAYARQFDIFIKHMGFSPAFIDGHQHVHHLPIVRDVILEKIRELPAAYIRSSYSAWNDSLKACIINITGARYFQKLLQQQKIPHNSSFAGVYDFQQSKNFPKIFQKILQNVKDGALVMCHPGRKSSDLSDTLVNSRFHEYEYFRSDEFKKDCDVLGATSL